MLGIFDSHAHYDDESFDGDRDELLRLMNGAGVSYIVNVSATRKGLADTVDLINKYPFVYGSAGFHPEDVARLTESDIGDMIKALSMDKIVAVGEIGLDYHYPEPEPKVQREWFIRQLNIACEYNMPVIIHSRDAAEETMDIMKEYAKKLPKGNPGVIHCYSYSAELAEQYVDMGYYIGIGGVLTFSNAKKLKRVADIVPIERILLETDCPYMAPTPHRGERNDSRLLVYIAKELAGIKGISYEDVVRITAENAMRMYGIEV